MSRRENGHHGFFDFKRLEKVAVHVIPGAQHKVRSKVASQFIFPFLGIFDIIKAHADTADAFSEMINRLGLLETDQGQRRIKIIHPDAKDSLHHKRTAFGFAQVSSPRAILKRRNQVNLISDPDMQQVRKPLADHHTSARFPDFLFEEEKPAFSTFHGFIT